MDPIYTHELTILPSQVDPRGRLSETRTFDLFMDVATEAAGALGLGWQYLLRRHMFWITVKTRIEFDERPRLLDRVQVVTWPERPEGMRCNRHYEIRRDGEVLVRGKTEWAIISMQGGRPQPLSDIMPADLEYPEALACPEPFPIINEIFPDPPFARHAVGAMDIDMARHMNNVAYIRALMDAFPLALWEQMDVRRMDVIFRTSAHEGDILTFRQRREGETLDILGCLPDGRISVLARLITRA